MLASEHYLHAKCLVQVAHPWHFWKHCGYCFIFWRDCPWEWSRRLRRPMPWKFGCRSCVAILWPGAVNGSSVQGALEGISIMELRKLASARNVGRGPDKKWLAVGELRIQLLEVLAPPTEVGCVNKKLWPKLNVCYMVQCRRMGVVLWWQCVGCCRWMMRKLHWLPNWKNFAWKLFHKVLSGSVVLCRKYQEMSFAPWLLRVVYRPNPTTNGWL